MRIVLFISSSHLSVILLYFSIVNSFRRSQLLKYNSRCLSYLNVIHQKEYDFKKMIEECSKTSIFTPAVRAAHRWINSNSTLTSSGLTSCIKIFGLANLLDDAKALINIAKGRGVTLNIYHYNALISACRKDKKYDDAFNYFHELKSDGLSPDKVTYTTLISICGIQNNWSLALDIFNEAAGEHINKDPTLYGAILSALERCGQLEHCIRIFNDMIDDRIAADKIHYNIMISAYGKYGTWQQALSVFQQMVDSGVEPDGVCVGTMTRILEKSKQWELAASIRQITTFRPTWNESRSSHQTQQEGQPQSALPLSRISFSDVFREAKRSGDFRSAVLFADKWLATQKKLTPGGVTACLNIYGHARLWRKAVALLDLLQARGIPVNSMQYNACMSACTRSGEYDVALEMFQRMKSAGASGSDDGQRDCVRTSYSYSTALLALERGNRTDEAMELLKVMSTDGVVRNTIIYNTVLSALGKAGRWKDAVALLESMPLEGLTPDRVTYHTVVSLLERAEQWAEAAKYKKFISPARKASTRKSVAIDSSAAGSLADKLLDRSSVSTIRLYGALGKKDEVLACLDRASENEKAIGPSHYNAAILALGDCGDWQAAVELLDRMSKTKVSKTITVYNSLISVLNEFGQEEAILEIRSRARHDGIVLVV